jgi:hypothetical protein
MCAPHQTGGKVMRRNQQIRQICDNALGLGAQIG